MNSSMVDGALLEAEDGDVIPSGETAEVSNTAHASP